MKCAISRTLVEGLHRAAEAAGNREICGLLLGTPEFIAEAVPIPNAAADPVRGFELDPAAHLAASRAAREAGKAVVGHYHSHPTGLVPPSIVDAIRAEEQGRLWLILGGGYAGMWISRRGGSVLNAFEAVECRLV